MNREFNFNIFDVIHILGIQPIGRRRGGTQECVCPFCGSKTGSFAVSVYDHSGRVINVYRCLRTSCDVKGNMLQLYMHVKGIHSVQNAIREIDMQLKGNYRPETTDVMLWKHTDSLSCISDEGLDRVYRKMYEYLRLSDRDRADLIRRGLSKDDLNEFRTIPSDKDERRRICRCLMREGLSLAGVPGFYKNRYGVWDINTYKGNDGYLCPAYSAEGFLYNFQIRLSNPSPDRKYVAFSSNGRNGGASAGARATYLWGKDQTQVIITEGILKATVIFKLLKKEISVVGIPGINQKKCLDQVLINLKRKGVRLIHQAYDMDRCANTLCKRDYRPDKCTLCSCGAACYETQNCSHKITKKKGLEKSWIYLYEKAIDSGFEFKRLLWGLNKDKIWNGIYKGFDDYLCALLSIKRGEEELIEIMKSFFIQEHHAA